MSSERDAGVPVVAIVIPARYASTRLPGKPLRDIEGKPMIQHVYEKASMVRGADHVLVATDDERIASAVTAFGGTAVMTSPDHGSGTERLGEVATKFKADIYVNLQGDEPLIRPADIEDLLAAMQADPTISVGTLCHEIDGLEGMKPNAVKVVLDERGDAMYFSRSPIPHSPKPLEATYLKHVGVYAYRKDALQAFIGLPRNDHEARESLEQLRLLGAGIRIHVVKVEPTGPGVDTEACLETVRAMVAGKDPMPRPDLSGVRLVITDVDGVLTDGALIYGGDGEQLKVFHARDGLGMRLLEEHGIRVAAVSGRDSAALRRRLADLRIELFSLGAKDKAAACLALMDKLGIAADATVYLGDDAIDLPGFEVCGISYAVADAPDYVKAKATHVLAASGGKGAFREVADAVLRAQGREAAFSDAAAYSTVGSRMAQ